MRPITIAASTDPPRERSVKLLMNGFAFSQFCYFLRVSTMDGTWEAFYYEAGQYWHASKQATLWLKEYLQARAPWLPGATLSGFTAVSSIRIIAYVPQILKAARDTNGASAISYTTWLLFLASNLMTIAYAIICIGDPLMAIVFLGNALACLIIVSVAALKRHRHQQRAIRAFSKPAE